MNNNLLSLQLISTPIEDDLGFVKVIMPEDLFTHYLNIQANHLLKKNWHVHTLVIDLCERMMSFIQIREDHRCMT